MFAPRHIFNVWTAYDWANGFGVNVGARALSSQYGDRLNVFKIDSYGLLNAAVRYTRRPGRVRLQHQQLTDTEYYASTLYDTQVYPGEPINVMGTVVSDSARKMGSGVLFGGHPPRCGPGSLPAFGPSCPADGEKPTPQEPLEFLSMK